MKLSLPRAGWLRALIAFALLAFAAPAFADNQTGKNASGTTFTFCTKTVSAVEYPCHLIYAWDGSNYQRVSSDSSGRVNVNINGTVTVGGGASNGAAISGNPLPIGGSDGTNIHYVGVYQPSDAFTNAIYGMWNVSAGMIFNGTTWDRAYEISHGVNGAGIGTPRAGILAEFDDVAPTACTENQFCTVRMTGNRFLYAAPISGQDGVDGGSGATSSKTLRVVPATDAIYTIAATVSNPTSTYTRPADTTAYASGDLVSNNTTAGSITVQSFTATRVATGSFRMPTAILRSNHTTGLSGVSFTVRFWTAAPTYTNGDNGAYAVATGAAGWIGTYSCTFEQAADGAYCMLVPAVGVASSIKLASGSTVYWDMQTSAAFTPQSGKTFTLTPNLEQD